MELVHDFTVPTSVEKTWAAFNDPAQVAPCFPGATLLAVDGDTFTGSAKIKLGPISLQYNGVGTYVERDQSARRAVIEAKGKDKRGNGTANATVTAQMRPDGEGTAVHVTTDLAVTGKPAQFGRGVMQDVSDKLLGQFVACLQTTLGGQEVGQPSAADAKPALVEVRPDPVSESLPEVTPSDGAAHGESAPGTHAPAYGPTASRTPPKAPAVPEVDVEISLLSTVGRVLLTRYAARALGPVALVVGVVVGYLLGRRVRR